MGEILVSASILAADMLRMREEIRAIEQAGADWIHVDVMDGHYVPNLTFGPRIVEQLKKATDLPLDVHLMIDNPGLFADRFLDAGADWITLHEEVHPPGRIYREKREGVRYGVSINPETPAERLRPYLDVADLFLVMTVHPGYAGQKMVPEALEKIREVRDMVGDRDIRVEVDGGIKADNARQLTDRGADVLVMGSGIFAAKDYASVIRTVKDAR